MSRIKRIQLYFGTFDKGNYKKHPKPFFFVYLGIESRVNSKAMNLKEGLLSLTPVEYHPTQTEVQIDGLINELEDIKKELRRKFKPFE